MLNNLKDTQSWLSGESDVEGLHLFSSNFTSFHHTILYLYQARHLHIPPISQMALTMKF